MKVCRICWTLLDGQLNRCNCKTGSSEIQFESVGEAINHFVNHEKLISKRAKNLERLVEKRYHYLKNFKGIRKEWHNRTVEELHSLLEKSKSSK
jgi:hypothetical protein